MPPAETAPTPPAPRPFVKWAGGKSRLTAQILARIPARLATASSTYAEPFAGGAAVFFALASARASLGKKAKHAFGRAILADQNEELVACYRAVRDRGEDLIVALGKYTYDETLFYKVRDEDPFGADDVTRGARLLFLNRTCYNGLWRVNSKGRFNVPFGRYENPKICDPDALRAASAALRGVELVRGDYADATARLVPGDFAYFDPPYVPLSKTASFTAYGATGFDHEDQARLAGELERLRDRGVHAMLSNADTEATRALYARFAMHVVTAARPINSKGGGRGEVRELLVTTWEEPGIVELSGERTAVASR